MADLDDGTGAIQIFGVKKVADPVTDPDQGNFARRSPKAESRPRKSAAKSASPSRPDALGRISAQTFKQVILQKVREAERENIFSEFSGRVGELVNCIVKRMEGPDLVVDMGKTEARCSKKSSRAWKASAWATASAA